MIEAIEYKKDTAGERDIYLHLQACAANFTPPLTERVDVQAYAKKLSQKAVNFEAWQNGLLTGLIAAYLNKAEGLAFITNVSVDKNLMGGGIAHTLLANCIDHAKEAGLTRIRLEVNANNAQAIRFYQKFSFQTESSNNDSLFMKLELTNQTT